jgi:hypothetical protein
MLVKVWSEMCEVLEGCVDHYSEQVKVSQQFYSKFVRLTSNSDAKLQKLVSDNQVGERCVHHYCYHFCCEEHHLARCIITIFVWHTDTHTLTHTHTYSHARTDTLIRTDTRSYTYTRT